MKPSAIALLLVITGLCACRKDLHPSVHSLPARGSKVKAGPALRDSVQAIIDKYIRQGVPGIQVTLKTGRELLVWSGGYARTESSTPFPAGATDWLFSLTKTYTAALVMKLHERGAIDLDRTIDHYLPAGVADSITGSRSITVKMLLNHTSGLVNFTTLPTFLQRQFSDPLNQPGLEEELAMVYHQPLNFTPGTDFSYCNTNYLLLQLVLQQAAGRPYRSLLYNELLRPLQLKETHYGLGPAQVNRLWFPDYYADVNADGVLENVTAWNRALGNSCEAYGGIAATAADAIRFYEALINGKVVSKRSLQLMTTWVQGRASTQPDYGLGLEYFQFAPGTPHQLGHEGDGIGCSTQLMYVPATRSYLYINCLAGRQVPGPFLFKTTDFKKELSAFVARWRP